MLEQQPFRIKAAPAVDFVMPDTTVRYEVERTDSQEKLNNLQFHWCRIDDLIRRDAGATRRALDARDDMSFGPKAGPHGQGETEWHCDDWSGTGEHLIVCEVIEDGKHYHLRYPQRVENMASVMAKGVAVPMHAADPLAWRDRLREKLDAMANLERLAPTDPSREEDAEREQELHEQALRRIELLIQGVTKETQSWPIGAVHVDPQLGRRTELKVCAVYLGPGKWVIIDWTAPHDRRFSDRWQGETLAECEAAWTSWWGSRYPKGRIEYSYDIRGLPKAVNRQFDCTGRSLEDSLITAGYVLSAALMIAVPVFGLGAAVFASGVVSTVASAGYAIFDRHSDGIRDWRADAFDVLSIISCVAGGLAGAGRFGLGSRVLVASNAYRALVATDVAATVGEALLTTEDTFEAIQAYARNDKKTPGERLALIVQLLQTAASGTFAYFNVRAATRDLRLKPALGNQLSVEEKLKTLRDPNGELHVDETPALEGHTETGIHETELNLDAKHQHTPVKLVTAVKKRVTDVVPDLYRAVEENMKIPGWQFRDEYVGMAIKTSFTAPNGARGIVTRAYDDSTLVLREAFLNGAPGWLRHPGIEMHPSRGTPTIAYLTMRQMHLMGVPFGGCKTVKMSNIQNIRGIAELEHLLRDGMSLEEAVSRTHPVSYAETVIVQSGHVIRNVELKGGTRGTFEDLLTFYEARDPTLKASHNVLLAEHGISRSDKVLMMYDIYIHVSALPE